MAITSAKQNKQIEKNERYIECVGKRKSAVARVRLTPANKASYEVNGKTLEQYFPNARLQTQVLAVVSELGLPIKFKVTARIVGGGISAQAEAMRLGLARCLLVSDPSQKPALRKAHLLTRDPRIKERRKFGLKKARKAPKWSK